MGLFHIPSRLSPTSPLAKSPTKSLPTFKRGKKKKTQPLGKRSTYSFSKFQIWTIRAGWLSVLYSSPGDWFVYLAALRDQRARESAPLPPPGPPVRRGSDTVATGRRDDKGAAFVLDLGVERLRRHWPPGPLPAPASLISAVCVTSLGQAGRPSVK